MNEIHIAILTLCVSLVHISQCDKIVLTIEPRPDQTVEVNKDATFTCTADNGTVEWMYENGSPITRDNSTRIYFLAGTLNFKRVIANDSGKYVCRTTDMSVNVTAEIAVYTMPSYFLEGMIIVGINCGLIFIFIVCGIHSIFQTRKDNKRRRNDQKFAPI